MTPKTTTEWRKRKVAELKGPGRLERRTTHTCPVELRENADGSLRLDGYACVTGVAYDVGGWCQETIMRGSFKRTLGEEPDVQLLVNHGVGGSLPLARTRSGTMSLDEDQRGLHVVARLDPEDPDVQSL